MHKQLSLFSEAEKEAWFVLTMYEPYASLLLAGIKLFETRPKGVTSKLPIRLFIHAAQKKMIPEYKQLADKYLGTDFKPKYSEIIGTGMLTEIITMTPEFIAEQTCTEIEVGDWKVGRKAWQIEQRETFSTTVPAVGCQAAPWDIDKSKDNPGLRQRILKVWIPPSLRF